MQAKRVLVVDDDAGAVEMIRATAAQMGLDARSAADRFIADLYEEFNPDIILLNILMADMAGFDVLEFLGERHTNAILILLSGRQKDYSRLAEHLSHHLNIHIHSNLPKPFRESDVRQHLADVQTYLRLPDAFQPKEKFT